MIIIRPITVNDKEAFIEIAFEAGIGMTSMPTNRALLEKRIIDSQKAFADGPLPSNRGTYLFVMEDLITGKIVGTCGIASKTGKQTPISFYRIQNQEQHNSIGLPTKNVPAFHVVHHTNYWSEIGSLFLKKDYRHSGLGRLLSLSRFLFIAAFPGHFDTKIFALMRGNIGDDHVSLFWEGVGKKFVDTSFQTLMELRNEGVHDLSQSLPKYPIYIELLPIEIQESIGKIHFETSAALKMLLDEGFSFSGEFDICDGGPKIEAETVNIRSVASSCTGTIEEIKTELTNKDPFIISNNRLDFRACLSPLEITSSDGIVISQSTAEALQVNIGDTIRYVSPWKEKYE